MSHSDRRLAPRYSLKIPLRFRDMEDRSDPEGHTGETLNISRTGLFFVARISLLLGSTVELALRVPRELSGSTKSVVRCLGRIVRMESLADGEVGYGARIDLRQAAGAVAETQKSIVIGEEIVGTATSGSSR